MLRFKGLGFRTDPEARDKSVNMTYIGPKSLFIVATWRLRSRDLLGSGLGLGFRV